MDNVQDALNKLYSQLYGSIVIPNNIVEQEELDAKLHMSMFGYDSFKYEEIEYENSNNWFR